MKKTIFILFIFVGLLINQAQAKSLEITEIHPNPTGKDQGNEWLEISNKSTKNTELKNWTIKNNKSHQLNLEKILKPGETILINKLKISLRNKTELLQLVDPNGSLIQEISYANAPEGKSYTQIESNGKITWQWTKSSKGEENPKFKTLITTVKAYQNLLISTDKGVFKLDPLFNPLIAEIFLRRQTQIEMVLNQENKIQSFKILKTNYKAL